MGEPVAHSRIITSKRQAVVDLFGAAGLELVGQGLPPDVRAETIHSSLTDTWVPERWISLWQRAVWEGPAQRDAAEFNRFIDAMVDCGFGRVRRVLVKLATPALMAERAAELWRDEHSHGTMTAMIKKGAAELRLTEHPYCTSTLAAMVIAESMRYVASLSLRAGNPTVSYNVAPEALATPADAALTIHLRWS